MIHFKDLKKGDEIRSTQLGPPIDGKLMESPKQGKGIKKVILIYSKGSTVGMYRILYYFYATDIVEVERDGTWHEVRHV